MIQTGLPGAVTATHRRLQHALSKETVAEIRLLKGLGVEGDAHCGEKVKHRSRVAVDPTLPNLRQVHLVAAELISELAALGYPVAAGRMGENITTTGLDLIRLPQGTLLQFPGGAEIRVTGLRNPCAQLNALGDGLMARLVTRDDGGHLIRRAGIMGVVVQGGTIKPGDWIQVQLPPEPHLPLERV